ncbi:tRNA (adenosine(37)-N6)-threonylcarbamoyltransferase complex dimerization subunit type 1 TsaB [Thiomicrorhabdus sp.]|uniref:tRNA (adenosine(37)-N6)-threonylcarbamoyltransferase complex dimerization subunit type 1 TsaB n=1 Tax=Thiomicrorhabdus sp. TaxID=2039724 RepID=UPI002AA9368F|nr:tRNA (adenosine(37)-N6)-threonylcarbamoyltransferase complex dimerization subunit type 1 TsaB [Thiomicrorhabdus sp.]
MLNAKSSSVLAVETSTSACSVALLHQGQEYIQHEILPQKHAHRVLEMVNQVIEEAGIKPNEIDLLAFGEGPGAFTGIRIASGVIQGLALGWDKPVLAVSSLLAMAEKVFSQQEPLEDTEWCAILDARMKEVYILRGKYILQTKELIADQPLMISPEQLKSFLPKNKSCIGVGDIKEIYPELVDYFEHWYEALPEAVSIARIAQNNDQDATNLKQEIPNPLYLRNHIADTIEERKNKVK